MKRFPSINVEISNICNLNCSFCPGTTRTPKRMSTEEFKIVLTKIKPYTDFLYFHILGEPLCHPDLEALLKIAEEMKFMVAIITNGTLLTKKKDILLNSKSHFRTVISLQSFEVNDNHISYEKYLEDCFSYAKAAENKKFIYFRLSNHGDKDLNNDILANLENYFPKPWSEDQNGIQVGKRIYVEYVDRVEWPTLESDDTNENIFCPGLREQIGILADGTVVPCCFDSDGTINLGNIFEKDFGEIINSERAQNIYNGFSNRTACEELCKRCSVVRGRF